MNNHVHPEFFKAFDHYKAMLEQYGDDHPITEQALILTMHYTPEHIKKEMDAKAKELNLLPPPSGYTDDGEPMYRLEDIASPTMTPKKRPTLYHRPCLKRKCASE